MGLVMGTDGSRILGPCHSTVAIIVRRHSWPGSYHVACSRKILCPHPIVVGGVLVTRGSLESKA